MALLRLARDMKSLEESPLPGVAAAPLSGDLTLWHFNLQGTSGELGGLILHGVMRVPPSYPSQPPEVRLCTPAPHPNVWSVEEGYAVCMDMLEGGSSQPYSGWSSSYCVGSILLQLQSTLFDERAAVFDQVPLSTAVRLADAYACPCGHRPGCAKPTLPTQAQLESKCLRLVTRPRPGALLNACSSVAARVRRAGHSSVAVSSAAAVACKPDAPASADSDASAEPKQGETDADEWREVSSRRTLRKQQEQAQREAQEQQQKQQQQQRRQQQQGPQAWGIRAQRDSSDLSDAQLRNSRRAKRRAAARRTVVPATGCGLADEAASTAASTCELAQLDLDVIPEACRKDAAGTTCEEVALARPRGALGRVPLRLWVEVFSHLPPEDSARFSVCGRFFLSLGEDGILWRSLFSQRYPGSSLTAESLRDWKHCFLLEVNHIAADLVCFHTKVSFRETVLGLPLDYSVNPRTQRVDYISTTLDLVSVEAFDSGLRVSQWNEAFKEWMPVYLTPEHFELGRRAFEKALVRLSPHWRTSRFHPHMALEVIPKLMNTMIVLLCDKGLEASDRALDGYFLLWRLLRAVVEVYNLDREVDARLKSFREPANRAKSKVPSIGDFLPLISVRDSPEGAWQALAQAVMEETFDRNVLWACRDHPEFADPARNVIGSGADMARLEATLSSTRVSKRLLMFHVKFLQLVGGQKADLFYGLPPHHIRKSFKAAVRGILEVSRWPDFFAACGRPCPGPQRLTDLLRQATKNSLRKGYHTRDTDFRRIHASGTSHILKKGESYQVASGVKQILLELGSDSRSILCGACLVYEDLSCARVVSFDNSSAYRGAVVHSGDTVVDGKSKHVIEVDLSTLPAAVTRLFFTLCACGCTDLSGFKKPSINMMDPTTGAPLCRYDLERAGNTPTVVMCAVVREPRGWRVTALGEPSAVRCCGNYSQVKRDIAKLRM